MHPVRAVEAIRRSRLVAGAALADGAGVPLELGRGDIVVRVARPYGVRAAVAGLAGEPAVALALAVELARLLGEALVRREDGGGRGVVVPERVVEAQAVRCERRSVRDGGPRHRVAGVAALAPREVQPGPARLAVVRAVDAAAGEERDLPAHRRHVAVAVLAVELGRHRAPEALGRGPWVALVAGLGGSRRDC